MQKFLLGVDIGGTKIESSLIRPDNLEIFTGVRHPTNRDKGHEHIIKQICLSINDTLSKYNISINQISSIGLALPGCVHPTKKLMENGNTQQLIDIDIITSLEKKLGFSNNIALENDAACFALAEHTFGPGKDHKRMPAIGIILGTGVGGGLVLNDKIYSGVTGASLELGHSLLISNGRDCYCGRKGCAEQYLSGTAIQNHYKERFPELEELKSHEIFDKASQGDQSSQLIIDQYKEHLIEFLTNLTNIFDPAYFVLGGGVSKQDIIYKDLEKEISKRCFGPSSRPKVYKHIVSDSSGALGAAISSGTI